MKNIFKYLSAFAIAGAVGLNTMNVSAENTCAAGETVHTNYYMFLNVNSAEFYKTTIEGMADGKNYTQWNGAYKYNNINKATILEDGTVAITKGSESTSVGASVSWTAQEYWQKYYTATQNTDENLIYTDGDESYLLHDKWWSYDENFENGEERTHVSTALEDALHGYILGNWTNLTSLINNGTSLPESKVDMPSNLSTSSDSSQLWKISRVYLDKDILSGITLNGQTVVYSPAVHYVKFCVAKTSDESKTITYDANTTDQVANMPSEQKYSDDCTKISTTVPVRSGYKFLGWSTNASSTTADSKYAGGSQYCGESIVLHAIWEPTGPYTVTYDANGGKDAPAAQSAEANACVTISSTKPTQSGNNFLGWSTNKDAQEADANFAADKQYCGEQGSITLYAVWQTQTGVSAHAVAFTIIALTAGAALLVAKKKNLFKQI